MTALGLPMVVVPYPHASGHQLANARVLGDAAVVLDRMAVIVSKHVIKTSDIDRDLLTATG